MHEAGGPVLVACQPVPIIIGRGEDDHGNQAGSGVAFQSPQHINAAEAGHVEVEQDRPRRLRGRARGEFPGAEQVVERLLTIAHDVDVGEADFAEAAQDQGLVEHRILDQQEAIRHRATPRAGGFRLIRTLTLQDNRVKLKPITNKRVAAMPISESLY